MRKLSIAAALLVAACGALPAAAPSPSEVVAVPTASPAAEPTAAPTATAAPEPTPNRTSEPLAEKPPGYSGPNLEPPKVALLAATFPMTGPSGTLVRATPIEQSDQMAKWGLEDYLMQLNNYRKSGFDENAVWSLKPPFRDVVLSSVRASVKPGIERQFVLESLRIDAAYQKPWGTQAILELTVTIRDKVLSGQGTDEIETGRLRLGGDRRLQVIDGWSAAQGRWWNGFPGSSRGSITSGLDMTIGWHLRSETWLAGMPAETYYGPAGADTPFARARTEWLRAFDRTKTIARTLDDVTAQVEAFQGYTELGDGLIGVLLRGVVVTTDAAGTVAKAPFERRIRVLQHSWGYPGGHMVVDEEATSGVWRSGGDIALKDVDRTFG